MTPTTESPGPGAPEPHSGADGATPGAWIHTARLHFVVVIFTATAFLGQWISLPAPAVVAWRTGLAALGAAAAARLASRRGLLPPPRTAAALVGIGAIAGLHWICFFAAARLATVSMCLAGMATTSLFTALVEPLLERRPVRPREVGLGCVVAAGILLVAGFERGRLAGLGVALLGALLAAIFPVLNRRIVRAEGEGWPARPMVMVAWEMLGACLAALCVMPLLPGQAGWSGLFAWQGRDWLWLLILAWVCTVWAYALHIEILRHVSAFAANLATNLEPVYGILAAAWLLGEHRDLHPGFYAGAATVVAANIVWPLLARRRGSSLPAAGRLCGGLRRAVSCRAAAPGAPSAPHGSREPGP